MTDYQSAEAKIATLERQVALDQEAIRILQETSVAHAAKQAAAAQVLGARLQRYEYVLREIMAFAPGTFRTLEDEIAIWNLANDALQSTSQSDAASDPPTYTALHYVGIGPLPNCDACGHSAQMHSPPNYGRCPAAVTPGTSP